MRCQQQVPYVKAAKDAKSRKPSVERDVDRPHDRPSFGRRQAGRDFRVGLPGTPGLHLRRATPSPAISAATQFGESEGLNNGYVGFFIMNAFFGRD